MMIYNTVDLPILVTVGDQSFRMERDSEKELKLPTGEYFFSIHKLDPYTGEPLRKYKTDYFPTTAMDFQRGKWGKTNRMRYDRYHNSTAICYGMTALLNLRRATKMYIRERQSDKLLFAVSSERYFTDLFDLTVEEGELSHRKDGCVDELTRTKLVRSAYLELIGSIVAAVAVMVGTGLLLTLLTPDQLGEFVSAILADSDVILWIVGPIIMIGCLIYDLGKIRKVKQLKNLPLLPTKEYYDYL